MEHKSVLSPAYELQACNHGTNDLELAIWQVPCPATPHISKPQRIARLRGRNMALLEGQILRRLRRVGISIAPGTGSTRPLPLTRKKPSAWDCCAEPWLPCATPNACVRSHDTLRA